MIENYKCTAYAIVARFGCFCYALAAKRGEIQMNGTNRRRASLLSPLLTKLRSRDSASDKVAIVPRHLLAKQWA